MKLTKNFTAKELKEVSDVALATITEHIEYIMDECLRMSCMGYRTLSLTDYEPKMTKCELEGLIKRLEEDYKLNVTVTPYEKEYVDKIDIHITWG